MQPYEATGGMGCCIPIPENALVRLQVSFPQHPEAEDICNTLKVRRWSDIPQAWTQLGGMRDEQKAGQVFMVLSLETLGLWGLISS